MDQYKFLISIIEASYIFYMFRCFKTTYSFNLLPLKFLNNSLYLKHQEYNSNIPVSHICPFGHDMAWLIAGYLVVRNFIPCFDQANIWIIGLITLGCFLNLNAFVYFLPIIIIELNLKKLIVVLNNILVG